MAEEGVSGGGGATNINVGVKVENESAKQAISNLAKGVQVLTKELQGAADASGKASENTVRLGQQAGPAMKETAKGAFEMKTAMADMAVNATAALVSVLGPMRLLQEGLRLFKEDLRATDELAKSMEQRRANFGVAGAGRVTADGRMWSGAFKDQLKGTIFGTAEGSQVAADVSKVLPRNATPEEASALLKTVTPTVAAAFGGLKQSAPIIGSAGHIFDLFDKKITPEQSVAYASALNNAGLIVNDGNKTAIAQLAAAIGPEKALNMAAAATESDVGMKGLFQFATAEAVPIDPRHKGPISMMDTAKSLGTAERMALLAKNPEAFGPLGTKFSQFNASGAGVTLASSAAEFARMKAAAPGDRDTANIADKLQNDLNLQSAKDRDATRADMRARLSEKLEAYIISQNISPGYAYAARKAFDYYDDPLTGIYEAAPGAIGMNSATKIRNLNPYHRISGSLRESALRSSGLMAVSGETQVTQPRQQSIGVTIRAPRGYSTFVQGEPIVGNS